MHKSFFFLRGINIAHRRIYASSVQLDLGDDSKYASDRYGLISKISEQ